MADNFSATPGSGATFGMDEVTDGTLGTVKVGFGKIMDGTLDSTNKLIVNASGEAKVTPTANSTVDLNKVAGTTTDTNSGNKSAGTMRVVLATDQPALTNKLLVTPDLPSGAATAAKQPALGTAGTASADVITVQGKAAMTPLLTDGSATTQPVSGTVTANIGTVGTLATAANQTTGNTSVGNIDTNTGAIADAVVAAGATGSVSAKLRRVTTDLDAVKTSVSSIDGKVTAANTGAVVISSSALPALASTSTKQSDGSQKTQVVDGAGNVIGATSNALDVNIKSGSASGTQYTEDVASAADPVGTMMIGVRRDTLSATEVSADGDNIAIKATNKGAIHVKHADTLIVDGSGVTQPVSGTFWQATQPVSGSVTANAGTNLNTSALALETGGNLASVATNTTNIPNTVGTAASAIPTKLLQIGGSDGTNARAISTTTGGVVKVDLSGTAANATAVKVDASSVAVPITDNSGSLTVDAPVGTPAFVRLSDGAAAITTLAVSLASVPSHAVTNAGVFAVQASEADGANVTLGAKADAKSTATDTTAVTIMSVLKQISASVQAPPSQAVTNTGTFVVQATLAAETTKIIGAINNLPATVDTNSGNKSASTIRTVIATDQPNLTTPLNVNASQMNGVAVTMGNGASGTGVQRVTLASDSTGQAAPSANATATGTAIYNNTALSNTKQAANASAGNLYGYHIYNPNSVVIYVQLWNIASAGVTVGTTAPTAVIAVPPQGWADTSPGVPITFGTALTIAATTTATGSTAPTTALLCNLWYK